MPAHQRILVVEDDPLVRQSFVRLIAEEHYEVHSAGSCREGLVMIKENRFDLILTDIRLGDDNGLKILAQAKKLDPRVVVFMITGFSSMDSMKRAMRKGAEDYIVKPVDTELLLMKIKNVLERQSGRNLPGQAPA
ncbi:response regulator [bacterium]|nr:response regulator [bacterium]